MAAHPQQDAPARSAGLLVALSATPPPQSTPAHARRPPSTLCVAGLQDESVRRLQGSFDACEKILRTPLPLSYSRWGLLLSDQCTRARARTHTHTLSHTHYHTHIITHTHTHIITQTITHTTTYKHTHVAPSDHATQGCMLQRTTSSILDMGTLPLGRQKLQFLQENDDQHALQSAHKTLEMQTCMLSSMRHPCLIHAWQAHVAVFGDLADGAAFLHLA
jgi:hypothetical protein